jgi:hypothetical protein
MKKKKLTHKAKKKYNKKRIGHFPGCTKGAPATMGRHYKKGRSKKILSAKQKKSLSKGRKVLSYLRTGRAIAEPKEPILIKEGFIMAGKKKHHKAAKHSAKMHGFEGKKRQKKVHHRVSHYVSGHRDGFDAGAIGLDLAGLLAGAIGLSFVASLVPIKDAKLKTLIPIAAGILGLSLPKLSKHRFINRAALGGLAIGGYTLTKHFIPQIPLMGATDTAEGIGFAIDNLPTEEKAILGILPAQIEDRTAGAQPGEMLGANGPGEMLGEIDMLEGSMPGEMLGEYEPVGASDSSDFE